MLYGIFGAIGAECLLTVTGANPIGEVLDAEIAGNRIKYRLRFG